MYVSSDCGLNSTLSFLLFPTAPSEPQALNVSFMNATTVSVAWEPPLFPNGIISNYTLKINVQSSEVPRFTTRASSDTSETFGGLEPATGYLVTVRGINSAGVGEALSLVVTTLPCEW